MSATDVVEAGVYTMAQAAQRLGITERHANRLAASGRFPVPTIKIGSRRRVTVVALESFLRGESDND